MLSNNGLCLHAAYAYVLLILVLGVNVSFTVSMSSLASVQPGYGSGMWPTSMCQLLCSLNKGVMGKTSYTCNCPMG